MFNFREIRYFDIKGEYTRLMSRAMSAPDGLIRIPLTEQTRGDIDREPENRGIEQEAHHRLCQHDPA